MAFLGSAINLLLNSGLLHACSSKILFNSAPCFSCSCVIMIKMCCLLKLEYLLMDHCKLEEFQTDYLVQNLCVDNLQLQLLIALHLILHQLKVQQEC